MKHRSQHLKSIFTVMTITFLVVFFITAFQTTANATQPMVASGTYHTVGLKSDGTAVAVGTNSYGECDLDSWADIVQVAAGNMYTVGLKSDRTVVTVGNNTFGQRNVGSWSDIIQVTAGFSHTVGLKSDGTVVAVGWNDDGQCDVGSWTNIVQVAAGGYHTVGLKSDGTAVAVGNHLNGECDVDSWTNIVKVAADGSHTVGLKSDGTTVAVGWNGNGQLNVNSWAGIVQVAAGVYHTVGLKSDGTAVAVGDNNDGQCDVSSWTDMAQVAAGWDHTVGLKSDGIVLAVGDNVQGQCDVYDWNLIVLPIADAGPDQVVFNEVTLDGSGSSETNATIVSFDWLLQHRENSANDRTAADINPTISSLEPGFYDVTLTVTDDGGQTGTDTMLLAVAGSCGCDASTMHIQSIIAGTAPASKNLKYGSVTVTIFDDCGGPVSGANITGTFAGDYNETITETTGYDGTAVITTSAYVKKPSYMFCVDDVNGSLTYDSSGNIDTCKSK